MCLPFKYALQLLTASTLLWFFSSEWPSASIIIFHFYTWGAHMCYKHLTSPLSGSSSCWLRWGSRCFPLTSPALLGDRDTSTWIWNQYMVNQHVHVCYKLPFLSFCALQGLPERLLYPEMLLFDLSCSAWVATETPVHGSEIKGDVSTCTCIMHNNIMCYMHSTLPFLSFPGSPRSAGWDDAPVSRDAAALWLYFL